MPSVPGYVHHPGHHCGSTALRNLLAFHGAEISEEMAFGLAILLALSRPYLGMHYPSDVLGGIALGVVLGLLVPLSL